MDIKLNLTYYANIMLDTFIDLLCSKLCWHNRPGRSGGSRGVSLVSTEIPFKTEDYFNTYIYAAIKNILCTVTQPFLIN